MEKQVKKFVSILLIAVALATGAVMALAQDAGGPKIAVLDMAQALLNSDVAQGVEEELQSETSEDQAKVRNLAQEAQVLQEQLQADAEVMSESEQRRIIGEIQELQNQYQFLVQKIQTLSQERMQQFQQTYAPNLVQAISEVVEEEGFDIVLRSESALYFSNIFDITAKVTAKLNEQ